MPLHIASFGFARVCAQMADDELRSRRGLMVEELRRKHREAPERMAKIALIATCRKIMFSLFTLSHLLHA